MPAEEWKKLEDAFLFPSCPCPSFSKGSAGKESTCNAGDVVSTPGSGRSPGGGNGSPLQYSCLENPMDGGAWRAVVHGVTRVGHDLVTKRPPKRMGTEKRDVRFDIGYD